MRYLNFDGLLNNGVSDFLMQDNELKACKNVWIYKIGKLEKVPGYTKATSGRFISGQSTTFLHYYYDTENDEDYQIAGLYYNAEYRLYYRQDAGWSSMAYSQDCDYQPVANLDAQNFLGKAFIVGHDGGTHFFDPMTINGTTYTDSDSVDTDLVDMPKAKFITRYRDLLYVINTKVGSDNYPTRAYFSSKPVDMGITWDTTTDFVDFGFDDGDLITGAAEALDRLVVFKTRSMWKYDESSVKPIAAVGCDSYKSILKVDQSLYWFNRNGFYRWRGAQPELISERAKEYIDAINPTKYNEVVAGEFYKNEYRAFIGDVTVRGIEYKNAWFCFDTQRERCYIRCTYNEVKATSNYEEAGKRRCYFTDDDGYLYKFATKADRVFADNGHEIDSFFETRMLDHGVPEDVKFTNHMTVFTRNNHSMKVSVEADNSGEFSEDNKDTINKNVQQIEIYASANRFRYRFYEISNGLSWEFEGFTLETQLKEESMPQ